MMNPKKKSISFFIIRVGDNLLAQIFHCTFCFITQYSQHWSELVAAVAKVFIKSGHFVQLTRFPIVSLYSCRGQARHSVPFQ